jgi:hypothetical protein
MKIERTIKNEKVEIAVFYFHTIRNTNQIIVHLNSAWFEKEIIGEYFSEYQGKKGVIRIDSFENKNTIRLRTLTGTPEKQTMAFLVSPEMSSELQAASYNFLKAKEDKENREKAFLATLTIENSNLIAYHQGAGDYSSDSVYLCTKYEFEGETGRKSFDLTKSQTEHLYAFTVKFAPNNLYYDTYEVELNETQKAELLALLNEGKKEDDAIQDEKNRYNLMSESGKRFYQAHKQAKKMMAEYEGLTYRYCFANCLSEIIKIQKFNKFRDAQAKKGLGQCWECGCWVPFKQLDETGYCGC